MAARRFAYHQNAIAGQVVVRDVGDFVFQQVALSAARDAEGAAAISSLIEPKVTKVARQAIQERAQTLGILPELAQYVSDEAAETTLDPTETNPSSSDVRSDDDVSIGVDASYGWRDLAYIEQELSKSVESATREASSKLAREAIDLIPHTPETFHGLALTLMRVIGVVATGQESGSRQGIPAAVLGLGNINDIGNHWTGRPHVHLIRFARQGQSASENERRFAADFGAILGRIVPNDLKLCKQFLPKSSRSMDDFAAYVTQGPTLWVHSRQSIEARKDDTRPDPNRDRFIHEQQVKAEVLEYGYALHRRIGERAQDSHATMGQLLVAERDLADFEWAIQDTGKFGEIRQLLIDGWIAFGVPALRSRIAEIVRVRRDIAAVTATTVTARWTGFIALIAGILAVPALTDVVMKPLWHRLGLVRPTNPDDYQLLMVGVAIAIVAFVLGTGYAWSKRAW